MNKKQKVNMALRLKRERAKIEAGDYGPSRIVDRSETLGIYGVPISKKRVVLSGKVHRKIAGSYTARKCGAEY